MEEIKLEWCKSLVVFFYYYYLWQFLGIKNNFGHDILHLQWWHLVDAIIQSALSFFVTAWSNKKLMMNSNLAWAFNRFGLKCVQASFRLWKIGMKKNDNVLAVISAHRWVIWVATCRLKYRTVPYFTVKSCVLLLINTGQGLSRTSGLWRTQRRPVPLFFFNENVVGLICWDLRR